MAATANAETPLSPLDFEAYATGKTLFYALNGAEYGAEEYLPGRRVRWSFLNGECLDGSWFVSDEMVCFTYDFSPESQCWSFYSLGGRLLARFQNDPSATTLYELRQSPNPLACEGQVPGV
ncbi:hypothetical protein [Pseudoruegeria sp. SHC-113]|uniref:hypothetical protein n=1 Tax=Pseudoruegeria sp. SHC-113 TaxID=2855439 RepID=UPI0021BB6E1E|nr:hypothetical protein [Pseudoruegeria sp. SHC-113]